MNKNTDKNGLARLILDLAHSDADHSFQEHLARTPGATQELASLLQLAKLRESKKGSTGSQESLRTGWKNPE